MNNQKKKTFIVGVSGATGVVFAIRLIKALLENPFHIYLIISKNGYSVLKHECDFDGNNIEVFLESQGIIRHKDAVLTVCNNNDYFVPPASGSFMHDGMVIAPCSMKTLGAIANGISDNLLNRAADVTLKEKRPLILLTRETPLNLIHIKNMEKMCLAGGIIMPPNLSFYLQHTNVTELIDAFIGRVLNHLNIEHRLHREWKQQSIFE